MCPRAFHDGEGLMDWALCERILSEIAAHPGTALVPFFRGESLMHPRFLDAMTLAKRKGIAPVQLVTNATLLTPALSEALIDLPVDFISLSLDALSPGAYESQRRGASYIQVMANVGAFLVARKRKGGRLPEVQVSAVETAATRAGMPAFIAYWKRHVDRVRIYEEHSQGGVFGALPEALGPRKPCGKPLTDLVIYCDGGVALCNQDWERKEPLGDIRTRSIAEVWRSAAYDRIRRLHREGRAEEDPTCKGCGHWAQYYREGGILGSLIKGTPSWRGA
jgi:radical SAM protein with 4Fe4S-binding SPASM domain